MHNIQRMSYIFKVVFQMCFLLLILGFSVSWIAVATGYTVMLHDKWFTFSVALFAHSMNLLILYYAIKLFSSYEKNEIFTLNNTNFMRNIGCVLLAKEIILPLYKFIYSAAMYHDFLSVFGIYLNNIEMLLLGFVIIINSWVMSKGYQLREQQQLTI